MNNATTLRIGLTMRVVGAPGYHEPRDAIAQNWPVFMRTALPDAQWLPIPNLGNDVVRFIESWQLNGFILTGGNDIDDAPIRDRTELRLLEYASRNNLPVLGICRGMQVIGIWAGAKLKPVEGHSNSRHNLHGIVCRKVNSYHNFVLQECPSDFEVIARTEDNEIEGFCHTVLPWEGWMWHPEREPEFSSADMRRIRDLFNVNEMA